MLNTCRLISSPLRNRLKFSVRIRIRAFLFGMLLREQGGNKIKKKKTMPSFFLSFSTIVFSTILSTMIELKLYRWFFLLYKNFVFKLELEVPQDFLLLLVLILVFVSWILVRTLWHFYYKKFSNIYHVPITIMESVWTLSLFLSLSCFFWENFIEKVDCAGKDSGEPASTSSPKPEWQIALDLPNNQNAPECLRSHIKEQLRYLFNIGRKTTLSDPMLDSFIEPLALNEAKVGFAKALLERINALQLVHYNRGSHIPFKFSTREEKERLYSIVWEYADKLPPE